MPEEDVELAKVQPSQHILVKKTLVKKDTWQKEVILDPWQKAVCKWYQKFSDKKLMNQILGKKFMEWIQKPQNECS